MSTLRLNISHDRPDSVLTKALCKIDDANEHLVSATGSPAAIATLLQHQTMISSAPAPRLALDLIGHSLDGVLQLGDWSVDGGQASQTLAQDLRTANVAISEIRLLGCVTAETNDGRAAMTAIANLFRTTVRGTTVPIGAGDFDTQGFTRTTALVDDQYVSQLQPDPIAPSLKQWEVQTNLRRKAWLGSFPGAPVPAITFLRAVETIRAETEAEADRDRALSPRPWRITELSAQGFARIFSNCEPVVAPDPGLLAIPDFELRTKAVGFGGRRVKRAVFLLDGSFVKFFPAEHPAGLIARVRPEVDDLLRIKAFGSLDAAPPRLWPPP